MKREKDHKPLDEIRRAIEAKYNPEDGNDTKTPWPPAKPPASAN
jgi:hypothetical protein